MNNLLWVALLAGSGLSACAVLWFRYELTARTDERRSCFRLRFPRDLGEDAITTAFRALASFRGHNSWTKPASWTNPSFVFELVAEPDSVEHRLWIPLAWVDGVRAQLRTALPSVFLESLPEAQPLNPSGALEYRLTNHWRPLRTDTLTGATATMLSAAQPLASDEAVTVQVVASPIGAGPAPRPGRTWPKLGPAFVQFLLAFWRAPKPDAMALADQRAKVAEPLFEATLRLGARASRRARTGHLLARVRSALAVVEAPGVALRLIFRPQWWVVERLRERRTAWLHTSPVGLKELIGLLAWPLGGPDLPGLNLLHSRHFPPAPQLSKNGRIFGDARDMHGSRPVGQGLTDSMVHLWLLGSTGSGKSTLVTRLGLSDVATSDRRALVVMEPKRDLVEAIAARLPADRLSDVIYLDAASDVLAGLNPLRPEEPDRELVADQVYGVFRQLSASWGPRLGDLLYTAIATLVRDPEASLIELPLLLGDDAYRRRAVGRLGTEAWTLRPVWAWFDALSPAERLTVTAPILTRVRPWIVRSKLRHLLGVVRPKWSFRSVLDEGRILLVSLNPGVLGDETVRLLGSLILQGLWSAALARPSSHRPPAQIYIDEWQQFTHFAGTNLSEILSLARGYRLGFTLANQSVSQLDSELRAAVSAHTRSKLAFALDHTDSTIMARELGGGVTPPDLQGLGTFEAIASLMSGGQTMPPVSLTTRPLDPPTVDPAEVRRISQERYGVDRDEIERAIRARHEPPDPAGGIGLRRRPT